MASLPSPGAAALAVRSAAELALLGATFFAAGRRAAGRLSFENVGEEIGVSLALGAGIFGTALFLLAAAGGLTRAAVVTLAAGTHAVALPVWRDAAARVRRRGLLPAVAGVPFLPVVLGIPAFILGLYPPWSFDETMYHLPIARALATSHSVGFLTNLRNPVYPQLVESLEAAMMLLFGDVSTHLVECLALIATAFAFCGFGRRWGGRWGGVLAVAFWSAHRMIPILGGQSYVDLDLALFFVVAYFAWEAWRDGGDRRWIVVAAALAGFAAATKYLGLAVLPVLAVLTLLSGRPDKFRRTALLLAVGFAALAPGYLWIYAETHNPVFPFLSKIFGHTEWDKTGVLGGFMDPFSAWSRLLFAGREALRGSIAPRAAPISALWFVEFALAVTGALLSARARRALVVAVAYAARLLSQDTRYVLPSLGLLAFGAALGLESLRREGDPRPGRVPAGILVSILAALAVFPAFSAALRERRGLGPIPTSAAGRSSFLRKQRPGYGAIEWLNRTHGHRYSAYVLRGEYLAYFAEGNFMGDWRGPFRFEKVLGLLTRPRRLDRTIRAFGADFFATDRTTAASIPADAYFQRHYRRVYDDGKWVVWQLGEF